jgi:hypothetical protein
MAKSVSTMPRFNVSKRFSERIILLFSRSSTQTRRVFSMDETTTRILGGTMAHGAAEVVTSQQAMSRVSK